MRRISVLALTMIATYGVAQTLTTRTSVTSAGAQVNAKSSAPAISADGRYVAFVSTANNLVAGDTNGVDDVFVRDRITRIVRRVSVSTTGVQANNVSGSPDISDDGRFVAFASFASNLVTGDTNNEGDIFVHDLQTGETIRASIPAGGGQSDSENRGPSLSADGRLVAFTSFANNMVSGDTNQLPDIFVRDLQAGQTIRVSVGTGGVQANSMSQQADISGNGRYVVFRSWATNLTQFDTNMATDVFRHDMQTGETLLVSAAGLSNVGNGESRTPTISFDGRWVAFESVASDLVPDDHNGKFDVFLRDMICWFTARASVSTSNVEGDDMSTQATVSDDGRFVTFFTFASNLVPDPVAINENVVTRDFWNWTTTLSSVNTPGMPANFISRAATISANGRFVAYESFGSNLVPIDTNSVLDVFVTDNAAVAGGPNTMQLARGRQVSGTLASVQSSNDDYLRLAPGVTLSSQQAPIEVYFMSNLQTGPASDLEVFVESSASSTNIAQTISLFNFQTCMFETFGTVNPGLTDTLQRIQPQGDLTRYAMNGMVYMRLTYQANGPVLAYPWQARVDQVRFVISE